MLNCFGPTEFQVSFGDGQETTRDVNLKLPEEVGAEGQSLEPSAGNILDN